MPGAATSSSDSAQGAAEHVRRADGKPMPGATRISSPPHSHRRSCIAAPCQSISQSPFLLSASLATFAPWRFSSSPNPKSPIHPPQSSISHPFAIGEASGTRIDRDALVKQATAGRMWIQFAADAEWPHTEPTNAPIRREFQLPANRAFIG